MNSRPTRKLLQIILKSRILTIVHIVRLVGKCAYGWCGKNIEFLFMYNPISRQTSWLVYPFFGDKHQLTFFAKHLTLSYKTLDKCTQERWGEYRVQHSKKHCVFSWKLCQFLKFLQLFCLQIVHSPFLRIFDWLDVRAGQLGME